MEVKVSDHEKYEKKVEVKVSHEELADRIDAAYKKYKKSVQIEGFRKGKVPIQILKKIYGKAIEAEVAEDAIPDFLQKAIEQEKIKFYDVSKVEDIDFNEKDGLTFTAFVKVEPEIELVKYKGLTLEKNVFQISDEDVDEALKNIQERAATMVTVDDSAQDGHFIIADFQKTDESGHPLIGEKFENQYLRLDTSNEEDQLSEQLLGVKAGDSRQIRIEVPGDLEEEAKTEFYSVFVKEVKEKQLPELDDEFAKDLGEETIESLKKSIRESIEKNAHRTDDENFEVAVIDRIVKENPIELPEFMIEGYLKEMAESFKRSDPNGFDEEEFRNDFRAVAIKNLKWILIRDKIAELENITVEDSEIDAYIEEQIELAGKNAPQVRRELRGARKRNQIRFELLQKKVIDLIAKNSKVIEKIITREDLKKQAELEENLSLV